jgi:hypothetical protein
MTQDEFNRSVQKDIQRLMKKGAADHEAEEAKLQEAKNLYNKKKQEPVKDEAQYKSYSPKVRVASMEDNEHEVQVKRGNLWKKHWGTNSMSNDMAASELDSIARRLADEMRPNKTISEKEFKANKQAANARREQISANASRAEAKRMQDFQRKQETAKNMNSVPMPEEQKQKQEEKKNTLLGKMSEIGKDFESKKPYEKMAKGGKISLKNCSVSTHTPSKKSSNW